MRNAVTIENHLDVMAIRQQFPVLNREVKGKPLVYFDNAATTQKPQTGIDVLEHIKPAAIRHYVDQIISQRLEFPIPEEEDLV